MTGVTWVGLTKFEKNLKLKPAEASLAFRRALKEEAEAIMTTSKQKFVPVALVGGGTLRDSGFVEDPVTRGSKISVTLGYGGFAKAYALAIHEHPSKSSPPTWKGKELNFNVGGVKYLERPMDLAAPRVIKNAGREVGEAIT